MAIGADAKSTFLAIVKGDASQAVTEFKKLGNTVEKSTKGAEGSVGKFKQATNGAFAEIKANAGLMAAGAGAAIGAFAVKAVNDFARLGVAVGKFSDATGLAAEDASRWIEVAGDIGIEATTVEKAIGRMNKAIDPEAFAKLGIEIAKTKDGATDVNETFLNVVDRLNAIKDPAERARVATKLLGRGWQEMSELIGKGSSTLRKNLESVSDAKVFDAEEVAKARRFRDAMDKLNDVVQDVTITIGEELAPAFADAADNIADLAGPLGKALSLLNKIGALKSPLVFVNEQLDKLGLNALGSGGDLERAKQAIAAATEESDSLAGSLQATQYVEFLVGKHAAYIAEETDNAAQATNRFKQSANEALGRLQALNDELAGNKAAAEFRTMMSDAAEKQAEINKEFADGKITAQEYWDATVINAADAQQSIIDYASEIDSLDPDVLTKIVTTYDPANPQATVDQIQAALDKERLYIKIQGIPVLSSEAKKLMESGIPADAGKPKADPKLRANGGPVMAGNAYLVGERGPEMIIPSSNGMVLNASRTAGALSGGGGGTVILQVRQLPTERELIDLVNGIRRKQGPVI